MLFLRLPYYLFILSYKIFFAGRWRPPLTPQQPKNVVFSGMLLKNGVVIQTTPKINNFMYKIIIKKPWNTNSF